jgi:hypothetical protein
MACVALPMVVNTVSNQMVSALKSTRTLGSSKMGSFPQELVITESKASKPVKQAKKIKRELCMARN